MFAGRKIEKKKILFRGKIKECIISKKKKLSKSLKKLSFSLKNCWLSFYNKFQSQIIKLHAYKIVSRLIDDTKFRRRKQWSVEYLSEYS